MTLLKEGERLIYAGETALRAPNGTPLPSVPQFMIIPSAEADPAAAVTLKADERLVLTGTIHNERKTAEERFAALKAGREKCPVADGIPLYTIEDAVNINPKTRLSSAEEQSIEPLIGDMLEAFATQMRKIKALSRQNSARQGGDPI